MNTNVADFFAYKKRWTEGVVYVGDLVEWQDFDGQLYEATVVGIEHKPLEGYSFSESVPAMPLWEKEEYTLYFANGISIAGEVLVRKIIRRASDKKAPAANGGHKYAH
jgi:hypothetical protein